MIHMVSSVHLESTFVVEGCANMTVAPEVDVVLGARIHKQSHLSYGRNIEVEVYVHIHGLFVFFLIDVGIGLGGIVLIHSVIFGGAHAKTADE